MAKINGTSDVGFISYSFPVFEMRLTSWNEQSFNAICIILFTYLITGKLLEFAKFLSGPISKKKKKWTGFFGIFLFTRLGLADRDGVLRRRLCVGYHAVAEEDALRSGDRHGAAGHVTRPRVPAPAAQDPPRHQGRQHPPQQRGPRQAGRLRSRRPVDGKDANPATKHQWPSKFVITCKKKWETTVKKTLLSEWTPKLFLAF